MSKRARGDPVLCVFNNLFACEQLFGKIEDRVLRFHSLYHVNVRWDSFTGHLHMPARVNFSTIGK